jgi:hypothetical protein
MNNPTAQQVADKLNAQLKVSDVQICNYARRFIIKKGSTMVAKGNAVYANGKGPAYLIGSFKAYAH